MTLVALEIHASELEEVALDELTFWPASKNERVKTNERLVVEGALLDALAAVGQVGERCARAKIEFRGLFDLVHQGLRLLLLALRAAFRHLSRRHLRLRAGF